jgi:hypothetical protein
MEKKALIKIIQVILLMVQRYEIKTISLKKKTQVKIM